MQRIIRKVWLGDLSPAKGFKLIQDDLISVRVLKHRLKGLTRKRIVCLLEAVKEKLMRVREAQEEIEKIIVKEIMDERGIMEELMEELGE